MLLIVALAIGIVAPSLRGFARQQQTVRGAARIAALMAHGRNRAINEATVYRFRLDVQGRSYWLMRHGGSGQPIRAKGRFGQTFALPRDVTARWVDASGNPVGRDDVAFYPTGRIDPGILELTGPGGKQVQVRSDGPTELYRVQQVPEHGRTAAARGWAAAASGRTAV